MIAKLARRLGFQPSVPVSLIDSWTVPPPSEAVELAPRGGRAALLVDATGRVQPEASSWTLDWTLAAGARWVPVAESEKITQRLVGAGVVETSVDTPAGQVVHRVGAAVVDGKPVGLIEIENLGGVAVAVGLAARPLTLTGRGHVGATEIDGDGIRLDGAPAVRFLSRPAATKVAAGADGDLLQQMPQSTDGLEVAGSKCRSGGAQAAAVWPLPHTATVRLVIELDGATSPESAVPTLAEVSRGWSAHLGQGMRVDVDDEPIAEGLAACGRILLTARPRFVHAPTAVTALAELGFGADAGPWLAPLERADDDAAVLAAVARWAQLGSHVERLSELDEVIGVVGRAAHHLGTGAKVSGPPWLPNAFAALADDLRAVDQPDVADRVASFSCIRADAQSAHDDLLALGSSRDSRWSWGPHTVQHAARYVIGARRSVVDDRGHDVRLLPQVPASWRGRAVDVFDVPLERGLLSYGIRWHGSRPALLWELAPAADHGDEHLRLSIPGLDPAFATAERSGETLLADPGWQRP